METNICNLCGGSGEAEKYSYDFSIIETSICPSCDGLGQIFPGRKRKTKQSKDAVKKAVNAVIKYHDKKSRKY